ncbi:LysR family transcriptional regulator [Bacillus sp. FJAT-29790]|uniref:selenium metabolism-associated LysR family transcriptional regulator n=1 Tax=Bacillus sp. FJAT-29790 TaxID=1895002 RepID=UPI001C2432B9|nr:selenium metabolism-associated LysR family transcriptional regulator [Bacillus sp. FJAT-29790]MBU8878598.1 LysR family transcriptional regulator [Bacillus sp. FJAT-29790]
MNLDYLKVFYVAANNKNFSQTAKDLHLSQSSVSLQIKQLEEQWDCQLFERTTKKISLTPAGEILYGKVKKLLSLMNETENELQELKGIVHGDLKVGASLTIGEYILPFMLAEFKHLYPRVNMSLKVDNSEQIIEKLLNHEINLGFIESMLSYPAFIQLPFAQDELIIISSPQKKFTQSSEITIDELLTLPFIIREKGSGTRQVMEDALRKNHVDPEKLKIIMELEQTEAIKSIVEAGLGVSIISKSAVKKELKLQTLEQLTIEGLSLYRNFYMVYHEEALKQTSRKLMEFIKKKA